MENKLKIQIVTNDVEELSLNNIPSILRYEL